VEPIALSGDVFPTGSIETFIILVLARFVMITKETDCEVVVIGGTAAGVATAVRAAREGCQTALVSYYDKLGGMISNMGTLDTRFIKERAPLYDTLVDGIDDHYRTEYGEDSDQYGSWNNGYFYEPKIAESIFEDLVAGEPNLEHFPSYRLSSVTREERHIQSVRLESAEGDEDKRLSAETFVDATYEGDLAATAGTAYRVGRESRRTYNEQFAGRVFVIIRTTPSTSPLDDPSEGGERLYNRDAIGRSDTYVPPEEYEDGQYAGDTVPEEYRQGDLDMIPDLGGIGEILSGSTGEGDDAIQAYNYRVIVSRDPENRRRPEKPPNYDREEYLDLNSAGSKFVYADIDEAGMEALLRPLPLPNDKADMNTGDLPGENHDYPEADWDERERIADRHRNYYLGLLYFLQNDDSVPKSIQENALEWGLATDEFPENDNFPWQMYVREARRLDGRKTFTENDARIAPGLERPPINTDAVGVNDFPVDSHACWSERRHGSQGDGDMFLTELTRPGQISYQSFLPKDLDNLLVPVALSASHVGFSTIRFEPTWMQLGESAGYAAALAHSEETTVGELESTELQRRLVEEGVMISFFNEFDMATEEPWVPAIQYLGTKGFFDSYNAQPNQDLSAETARNWARTTKELINGDSDSTDRAQSLPDTPTEADVTVEDFEETLRAELQCTNQEVVGDIIAEAIDNCDITGDRTLSRGDGARIIYQVLGGV